jgi:Cu/Ag efflux protein CusF
MSNRSNINSHQPLAHRTPSKDLTVKNQNKVSSLAVGLSFLLLMLTVSLGLTLTFSTPALSQHSHNHGGGSDQPEPARIYSTEGQVLEIDPGNNRIVVEHGPIPQVGWEAMTMGFQVYDPSLLKGLKTGDKIRFDIRFQGQNYQIVDLEIL